MPANPPIESQPDAIREELKVYRKRHRLTQSQVGSRLNVSQARLSAFETGKNHSLRHDKLEQLESLLAADTSNDVDSEEPNILRFKHTRPYSDSDSNTLSTGASSELRAEMKAQVTRTMGRDTISVALVNGMSDSELYRAYLILRQLDS